MQTLQTEILKNLSPDCFRVLGYKLVKNTIEEYVGNLEAPSLDNVSTYVDDIHGIMSDFDIQASDDREAYQQHYAGNDSEPDYIPREV